MKSLKFLTLRRMEAGIFLVVFFAIFGTLGSIMGVPNMLNTLMKTAYSLLMETVFYLMAIVVLSGALSKLLVEFGVVRLLELLLRPLMKPLFNLPGVASLGAVMTFLSDNPAIMTLNKDKNFSKYFNRLQLISFTNFASAFGMGLIVIVFMSSLGYGSAAVVGLFGAFIGSFTSCRLMQRFVLKDYPEYGEEEPSIGNEQEISFKTEEQSLFLRILNSLLDGGKTGVELGLAIIPGVLIISTFVMMLTFGPSNVGTGNDGEAIMAYTGGAYEGIELLPKLAGKIGFLFRWLFGFQDSTLVAFPIISLGSVGAALGLMPKFEANGIIDGNVVAVFSAMGMCWSGYLSTHTAMLDSLGYRHLTSKDLVAHTLGGIVAGAAAHWAYVGFIALGSLFSSSVAQTMPGDSWMVSEQHHLTTRQYPSTLQLYDNGTYRLTGWLNEAEDTRLEFTVNDKDQSIHIENAYMTRQGYVYVSINEKAAADEPFYAVFYPGEGYSKFVRTEEGVKMYIYVYIYNGAGKLIESAYYWFKWGTDPQPQLFTPDDLKGK
jgi:hypothetical protein